MEAVSLGEKLALFTDCWSPKVVAELNGQHVKLARLLGPFVWHAHADEDELFLVLEGAFRMEFRDAAGTEQRVDVREGEFLVVPRGVEHRPVADQECAVLLFEPASTLNTGDAESERTVHVLDRL